MLCNGAIVLLQLNSGVTEVLFIHSVEATVVYYNLLVSSTTRAPVVTVLGVESSLKRCESWIGLRFAWVIHNKNLFATVIKIK
jgi:hypothetical protein